MFAGIEAGGTKWVCAVGDSPDNLLALERFPTTTTDETIERAIAFLRGFSGLRAIGVASFGPLDLHADSPTYGFITTTPKPGWQQTDVVGPLRAAFGLPIGFDTDVNGAALGEARWGAGRGPEKILDTVVYLTIGTGIGGGALVNGRLLHGALHPEMGHMLMRRDEARDPFAGSCPFHGDCWEGLAAGSAMEKRWGLRAETLPADHPAWALEAHYLAQGLVNLTYALSPQRFILGGGVMHQPQMFALVRAEVQQMVNGYLQIPQLGAGIDDYIVPPSLGDRAGVLGAIALAEQAYQNQ
jgi:fructokinase